MKNYLSISIVLTLLTLSGYGTNWSWSLRAGGSGNEAGYSTATDISGNTYVTGGFTSTALKIGNTTLYNAGAADIFIIKYNPSGTFLWSKSFGSSGNEEAYNIATDNSGNIFITGYFAGNTLSFDSTVLTNAAVNYTDIFIAKFNPEGSLLWAKSAGGTGHEEGYSITTDASGNAFVTGYFGSPSITFGNNMFTNTASGYYDFYIVKYDPSGNVVWANSAGGDYSEAGFGVKADANGNVIVTGSFNSTSLSFGSTVLTNIGFSNIFLVKYNSAGNITWARQAGGTGSDEAYKLAIDNNNVIYLTGYFSSPTIAFGFTTLTNASAGNSDIFITKYNQAGIALWAKSAGGTTNEAAYDITVDNSENVILTGSFTSSSITFGNATHPNSGGTDIFIVKFDALGNVLWTNSYGSNGNEESYGISSDGSGNITFTGYYSSGTINLGTSTFSNFAPGYSDIITVKLNSSGNILWAKSSAGSGIEEAYDVTTDNSGNVIMTGYFGSPDITFGTTSITNSAYGGYDIFLVKYDSTGNLIWADSAGSTGNEAAYTISTDNNENIYIAGGYTSSSLSFGSETLSNQGLADIFVTKYNAAGAILWAKCFGGTDNDEAYSISNDNSGNTYLTGYFSSNTIDFGSITLTNTSSGNSDIFITKLDVNGNVIWARGFGGSSYEAGNSIACDNNTNLYVTGSFLSSTINPGGALLNNQGNSDVFILKYSNDGNLIWAKSFGTDAYEEGLSIKTDNSHNIIVTGYFLGATLNFDNYTVSNISSGTNDMFLTKLNPDGFIFWANRMGGAGNESGNGLFTDQSDNIYVTGGFDSPSISTAGTVLTNAGSGDIFISKYNPFGVAMWAESIGSEGIETSYGISGDNIGNIYISGSFSSSALNFGTNSLQNAGYYDLFLANLHSDNLTDIPSLENESELLVYPNPTNGTFTILIPENTNEILIMNTETQLVRKEYIARGQTRLDLNLLKSGVYFVCILLDKQIITRKLVVTAN